MSRPDEGLIHEWLDGECSAEEAARIERLVATDPAWAAAVAEARGLIAASSRIVAALDAVPHAMPEGSKAAPDVAAIAPAAPEVPARAPFRVRPWMKMAAGLVLVAGTAYAIREQTREVFTSAPVATERVVPATESVTVAAPSAATAQRTTSTADVAPVEKREAPQRAVRPAPVAAVSAPPPAAAGAGVGSLGERDASVAARAPSVADASTLTDSARTARRFAELQRRLENSPLRQVVTTGTRGAEPEKILDGPNSVALVSSERIAIECWQVTSPDSLRTLLRSTDFRPGQLDSLLVEIPSGSRRYYSLFRAGDTLRGPVTAKRVECPKP